MSFNGKPTPLTINVLGSFLVDQGLQINPTAVSYMGSSTSLSNYTPGSLHTNTCLGTLASVIRLAYTKMQANQLSSTLYNSLISLGSQSIPALGNSKPSTYTRTYSGELASYGFLRLIPYQAYKEFYINSGKYSDFLNTFSTCNAIAQTQNTSISAMINSNGYLDGTYSNMNDLITSDITGVSLSTLYWGQDLIAAGKSINLNKIDKFGEPVHLLRTINDNRATSTGLNVALLAAGMTSTDLEAIFNGQEPTLEQQRLMYACFNLVMGDDLQDILIPLNVQTQGLNSLADLLNPKKLFPNSYQTLTYPEYNISPKPTNSKTYYLTYKDGEVDIRSGSIGFRLINILPSDIGYACDAFSMAMMQIKNIKSMNIEKFSQVVANLETVTDLGINGTSQPTDAATVNNALPLIAKGSNTDGTYNMCDFFGSMTDLHYDWAALQSDLISLQTTTLNLAYTNMLSLLNASSNDNYATLQSYINQANSEIANILSNKNSLAVKVNKLYNTFGTYLQKEQDARDLALSADLSGLSTNTTFTTLFVNTIGSLSAQTELKGPARVLENIANNNTIGGKSLNASMREARNAMKLSLTGGVQDNEVSQNTLVTAPITGSMTSLGVPIVTGAAVVPGSLAGSPETTLIPPNLSIFNTPSNTKAVLKPSEAVDSVTICNCDCWDK
jgi:hypothetical protein